jgi:hypothetical protein
MSRPRIGAGPDPARLLEPGVASDLRDNEM